MKEPHKQGLAYQFGRESCAGFRERAGEALTAGNPGQPLGSEIITLRVPTLSCQGEGHTRRSVLREFLFDATESETLCMDGNSHRGNRETSVAPVGHKPAGRSEKASCRAFDMHAAEESDDPIVPGKRTNKTGTPAAESVEERGSPKGNPCLSYSRRTQCRITRAIDGHEVRRVATVSDCCDRHYPREEPDEVVPHVRICAGGGPQGPSLPRLHIAR